ncbi:MAG: glycosyltransferase family 25 protein, partial [bacterium]
MKIGFYVINLDDAKDRLDDIKKSFELINIPFCKISAIDGKKLKKSDYFSIYKNLYYKPLSLEEIGCYMSHIKCWKKVIDDGVDYAVILEDDVLVDKRLINFLSLFSKIEWLSWDIIKLISSVRKAKIIYQKLDNNLNIVKYHPQSVSTCGQIITQKAAKKLLLKKNISRPVDVDLQFTWENNLNIFSLYPDILNQQVVESTIVKSANRNKSLSIRYWLNKWKYEMYFFLRCFVEN